MKLEIQQPNIEISTDLDEKFFSIGNAGMLFDILRSKMYSNPILAICREYTCNAIDSHREAGKPTESVVIHLPNSLEPYFKVKDFGVGISPDRMENIFIKYGNSTKREDNIQMGAFGLGAKCAFSMVDSFSINTNYNGINYHYSCFIDETKVGKLALLHEAATKECNGTEIIIPVLTKNFNEYATWTEQACRYLKDKIIIKGGHITWEENKIIVSGTNWAIAHNPAWERQAKMIIDGIEYPLEIDVLRKYADSKLIDASRGKFILYFEIGELSLSANREQIYLDEKTQNVIRKRLETVQKEIKKNAIDKMAALPNLWEANLYYRKELKNNFNNLDFLGKMSWQGVAINEDTFHINCSVYYFIKGKYSHRRNSNPDKISRSLNKFLSFEPNTELYINDLALREPTPRHVKRAFEANPSLSSLQVICPNDKVSIQDLNASIRLDLLNPKKLSSITKASSRAYTPSASRLLVFKFDVNSLTFRQVSYASVDEDVNNKILTFLSKDNYRNFRNVVLKNKKTLSNNNIKTLIDKYPDYSVYGVDLDTPVNRLEEDFSDLMDIEDFLDANIIKNNKINYIETKFAYGASYSVDDKMLKCRKDIEPVLKDPDSLFIKRIKIHEKIKNLSAQDTDMLHLYENINGEIPQADIDNYMKDNPQLNLEVVNNEYDKRYPLINYISYYDFKTIIKHIADYINMVDLSIKEKQNV
jgi:hypothetical protein